MFSDLSDQLIRTSRYRRFEWLPQLHTYSNQDADLGFVTITRFLSNWNQAPKVSARWHLCFIANKSKRCIR